MLFIDQAKIFVKAGNGGKGCRSFYRDKYNRKGTPDGGNGGRGADIIVKADRNLYTLLDFKYNRHFRGKKGSGGSGKDKKGKNAEPVVIRVPVGTIIRDLKADCLLRDLDKDQQEVLVARGGMGGLGNGSRFEVSEPQDGEEKELLFDLRLIAEAGVIGFPNAGKSTLISAVSNAHPEIAAYPFTTKYPVLGVVSVGSKSFVIADIPGLIKGSSAGKGLGDRFLRHIERTNLLIHVIDMAGFEGREPLEDYKNINKELENYSEDVCKKPQIIVANKMDLEGAEENLKKFKARIKKKVFPVSALKKEGLEDLIEAVSKRI